MTTPRLTQLRFILTLLAGIFLASAAVIVAPGAPAATAAAAETGSWRHHNDAGIAALKNADFKTAKRHSATALDLARKEGTGSAAYATALYGRVKLLVAIGKHKQVGKPARRVIAIREKLLGPDHLDLAEPLALYGVFLGTYGRHESGQALVDRAMAILQKHGRAKDLDYTFIYDAMGLIYGLQKRLDDALSMFAKGLKLRQTAPDKDIRELAQSYNNLGFALLGLRRFAEAGKYLRHALKLRQTKLGPKDPDTAQSLSNMGTLSMLHDKFGQAEKLYKQALAIRVQAYGPIHPMIGSNHYNLGLVYFMRDDLAMSDRHYRRALAVQQEALGTLHPSVADTLENFSAVMLMSGNLGEAARFKARAALIRSRIKG